MRPRPRLLPYGLVALASFGCGDSSEPSPVNLRVSVPTTGVDRDASYVVRAGAGPPHTTQGLLLLSLPPGEHDVVLGGIAPNCAVQGPDSVRVTIALDQVATVAFQVECRAVTGAIEVAAPTSGRDFDPDGYDVHVDGVSTARVFAGGSVVVEEVLPGSHVVRLDEFSANCSSSDSPSRTVVVTAGGLTRDTVRTALEVSCQGVTGDVLLTTTTAGADLDQNGYTLMLDGELVVLPPCGFYDYYCEEGTLFLEPNGDRFFAQVPPGDHTYQLGDIASNCTVNGSNPRTVSVAVGETSALLFDVSCTDVP
ncbi:hypothetical protein [Actinokineospora sp.]|uniref:hypothetical protein n=1 Tax=Actinokineospora sp. TaxID=1872133 RepID=UPI003D6ADAE7